MLPEKSNVIIVDDHQMILDGLRSLVSKIESVELCGVFSDPHVALDFIWKNKIDLIVLDVSMPQMNGMEFLHKAIEIRPAVKIIILSMHSDVKTVRKMVEAGAMGYVLKSAEYNVLREGIETVASGSVYYDPEIKVVLNEKYTPVIEEAGKKIIITKRELRILELLSEGMTTEEIAEKLFISKHTVSTHRKNIGVKFGTNRLVEILAKAKELDFIS
ncbi:MAG: response regulator [Bacteroidetes bacterium]|nr:response regulator [Bacteroidota bacterium]